MSVEIKEKIKDCITSFKAGNLAKNAIALFNCLGYNTERQSSLLTPSYNGFKEEYVKDTSRFNEEKALVNSWDYVDLLFQLSKGEVCQQNSLFDTKKVDNTIIEAYLFFAIELQGVTYSRTVLAQITREVNKLFPMPVMILFKSGKALTLSIINRRLHKRNERKDVLEKVTVIKDISVENPHRAHIEILYDLSFGNLLQKFKCTNFVELHNAWQEVLDTKELNKRFYKELSNWYFWAIHEVVFPGYSVQADKTSAFADEEKIREHNAKHLIRMLTRILFVWFVKEKDLIPDEIFDVKYIKENLLNDFEPHKKMGYDYKANGSRYYRAILQNLFFATLNQTVGKREFRRLGMHQNATNLMRYESYFKNPKEFIKLLENKVPFMNGGLFECLDAPDPVLKGKQGGVVINYVDGFSDREDNPLCVPDYVFFGTKEHADLSSELNDKKQKDVIVNGLFEILKSYKFTVTENTPIEEDIALDPELLGRVFENLLASYNPETKTTARKQTGSFYTPREIVDYMVDESLKAYLKQKLETEAAMVAEDAEAGLELLLGYNEKEHLFSEKQRTKLIKAIDNCKILDPACGSGAFPMGILHKLVHVLHKLDPKNEFWKERQIEKASSIGDADIRDQAIEDIEFSFENNELDYGRKLYLIENCIYGVDIQPIATQISKLRFFISLIVDQKVDRKRDNFGIRPLPNLETKFVAANTLIGIAKPKEGDFVGSLFDDNEVKNLEDKLIDIRHRIFSAKTPKTKRDLREKDKSLRENMASVLVKHGFGNDVAKQLASWDPYDQNVSCEWFDAEWMFGILKGFDITIGNPPYVQIQNFSGMQQQKDWERQKFETYAKTGDIYCLFYERGYQLLRSGGVLTFITSNKWMRANYGKVIRKFFNTNGSILQLIDFGDSPIFENATTYTNILVWKKTKEKVNTKAWDLSKTYANDTTLSELLETQGECDALFGDESFVVVMGGQAAIKRRIEAVGVPLKDWDISINYGIKTGLNEAFIIDGKKKDELIAADPKSTEILKPILRGRDIKRYKTEFPDLWLINSHNGYTDKNGNLIPKVNIKKDFKAIWLYLEKFNKNSEGQLEKRSDQGDHWSNLRSCAYLEEVEKDKILYAEIVYDSAFYYDMKSFYPEATTFIMTGERLKYLTALLNSKLLTYSFKKFYAGGDLRGDTFRYKKVFIELIPVPKISTVKQLPFEILVDCILFCKTKNGMDSECSFFERIIDALVYDLYFADSLKKVGIEITSHLTGLPLLQDNWADKKKLAIIDKLYHELADPKNPVSISLFKLETVPEVRIIEGLDK